MQSCFTTTYFQLIIRVFKLYFPFLLKPANASLLKGTMGYNRLQRQKSLKSCSQLQFRLGGGWRSAQKSELDHTEKRRIGIVFTMAVRPLYSRVVFDAIQSIISINRKLVTSQWGAQQ